MSKTRKRKSSQYAAKQMALTGSDVPLERSSSSGRPTSTIERKRAKAAVQEKGGQSANRKKGRRAKRNGTCKGKHRDGN